MEALLGALRGMDGRPVASFLEDGAVDDTWSFMVPWCDHVRDAVGYWEGESSDPPYQSYRGLQIHSPRRTSSTQSDEEAEQRIISRRFKLREALKLLSVVALVDNETWRKLLIQSRVLAKSFTASEKFDGLTARFLLDLPYGRRIPADDIDSLLRGHFVEQTGPEYALQGDLVFFCGVEQHDNPSPKYNAALRKIIKIWRSKRELGDVPNEIEVPVTIQVHPALARSGGSLVNYVQTVLKAVRHLRSQTWPPTGGKKGLPRVSFVLESIGADLRPVGIRSEVTALVETMANDGIFCSGLSFWQGLGNALAPPAKRGAARKSIGKLLTSLFGGSADEHQVNGRRVPMSGPRASTSTAPSQLILDSANIFCDPSRAWFFERACSAAVVNQTTTHVSISSDSTDIGTELASWRWRWVCYGFFSERAQRLSRLQRLTLQNVALTGENVDAMRDVMTSNNPEEDLLGLPHPQQSRNNYSIKSKKRVRLQPMDTDEELGNNAAFTVSREIRGVKLLSDVIENGWVDVLVPGFGKCQTRRTSLVQEEDLPAATTGVSSLMIMFKTDPDDDVLCRFLELIGSSLVHLSIQVLDFHPSMLERIAASCPQLREVSVCTPGIDVRFQVRDRRLRNQITVHPQVPPSFEDISELLMFFCVPKLPFASSVRRLRVYIRRNTNEDAEATPLRIVALLYMLQRNCSVEYLDVVATDFRLSFALLFAKYHLQKLPIVEEELPLRSKLAFLSVMTPPSRQDRSGSVSKRTRSSRCLYELDRNTTEIVFAFAANPAVRKVFFRHSGFRALRNDHSPI